MIHVVTVGTSILKHVIPRRHDPETVLLTALCPLVVDGNVPQTERTDAVREAWTAATPNGELSVPDNLARAAAGLGLLGVDASAELSSIRRQAATDGTDSALLLASDTAEGLAAAYWVALWLAQNLNVPRIRFTHDAATDWQRPDGPTIYVAVLPGLNAATAADFTRGMLALGPIGMQLWDWADPDQEEERIVFHLSGGYKASIPFLTAVAETLRSFEASRRPTPIGGLSLFVPRRVHAVILHESADSAHGLQALIDVPMRVPKLDRLRWFFDAIRRPESPGTVEEFHGWLALPDAAGTPQLTPLGEIVATMVAAA